MGEILGFADLATAFSEPALIEVRQVNQDRGGYCFRRPAPPPPVSAPGDVKLHDVATVRRGRVTPSPALGRCRR